MRPAQPTPEHLTAPKRVEGVLDTDQERDSRRRLELLAWLLDDSIPLPGVNARIGIDGLLGLIPGLGDLVSAAISTYIVAEATRLGASRAVILRMSGNVIIDTLVGAIPVLGDLFDFGFKSNKRNVRLLSQFLDAPRKSNRTSWLFLGLLTVVLVACFVAVFVVVAAALRYLLQ